MAGVDPRLADSFWDLRDDAYDNPDRWRAVEAVDVFQHLARYVEQAEESGAVIDWRRDVAERMIAWRAGAGQARTNVSIGYPFDRRPDDESWLSQLASRHDGELSDLVKESFPPQRDAWFNNRDDAQAFLADLAKSGRWRT